jgi:rare lipoprotein A
MIGTMKTLVTAMLILTTIPSEGKQIGVASWYGTENRVSSTGKRIQHHRPALAHRTLPIGTTVKITNIRTNKFVIAVVEDRGPYVYSRIVDVNKAAAKKLDMINSGTAKVIVEKIK